MKTLTEKIVDLKSIIKEAWPTFDWAKQLLEILGEIYEEAKGNSSIARTWESTTAFENETNPLTPEAAYEKYGLTLTIVNEMIDQKYDYIKSGDSVIWTITHRTLGVTPVVGCYYKDKDANTDYCLNIGLTADGKIDIYVG